MLPSLLKAADGYDTTPASSTPVTPAPETPPTGSAVSAPVLQNTTGDGITVVWAVNGSCTGWVEYGETNTLGQTAYGSVDGLKPFDDKAIKVRVTGLKPGTTYFYRAITCPFEIKYDKPISGTAVPGITYQFKTLDPAAAATSFSLITTNSSLINDPHESQDTMTHLVSMIQAQPTDSLIWNGDIFNSVTSEQKIAEQILNPIGRGVAYAATLPLIWVRGNHQGYGLSARFLKKYCDVPNNHWYYTLRQGPVAFVVLDTGDAGTPDKSQPLNDFTQYISVQQEWLRSAIEEPEFRNASFRVVLLHIPLAWATYDAGSPGKEGNAKWRDLFVKAKIDLIISGDVHNPAWVAPGVGTPYGQLTGGGQDPTLATLIRGKADQKTMNISMCGIDGKELFSHTFNRQT